MLRKAKAFKRSNSSPLKQSLAAFPKHSLSAEATIKKPGAMSGGGQVGIALLTTPPIFTPIQ
ncbi:hypothetical protein PMIT1323_00081 [Prochlorococcus marinus str. MIT 1323]|nr:hypothetical protein PMIT1323_00081 [Prochlorococcus marinus str. MIT 1323]